ncbi:MAG TPA: FAD-dependent oxidoreductase [Egibacteraceae bacterium]|nr:FAD-dependent oxidoreductase [Egibacteraceae bacterium]
MVTEDFDVVVVGGGIQGLVLLRELSGEGYGCILVTKGPLGAGQTLHSHGALISGMGLVTGALSDTVEQTTVPYLRRLGVAVHRDDPALLLLPDAMVETVSGAWQAHGYRPRRTDPSVVPGLRTGAQSFRVPVANVERRRLVEALSLGLVPQILQAEVIGADDGLRVRTVAGEVLHLRPRAVVVAAGCGTKGVLRHIFGVDGPPVERITYSRLHMLCLRAPSGVLPSVGALVSPDLLVVGHQRDDGPDTGGAGVDWLVAPVDPSAVAHEEAPDDALADVDPHVVALAVERLKRLFPDMPDDDERVRAAVFAGYKQNVHGEQLKPACELVDPDRNLVMALPSVLAHAVPNARDAVALLRERNEPRGEVPDVPGRGEVAVAEPYEDSGPSWHDWGAVVRSAAG